MSEQHRAMKVSLGVRVRVRVRVRAREGYLGVFKYRYPGNSWYYWRSSPRVPFHSPPVAGTSGNLEPQEVSGTHDTRRAVPYYFSNLHVLCCDTRRAFSHFR